MLASGALCRLAADAPKTTTHTLPQLAGFLQRALLARNASTLPAVRALSRAYASARASRRSYATTARATKPTETVKKAVKAKAVKKPAAKKTKKAAPAKKSKKKVVAKKRAPKKKAAPKKRVKKVLTPEQQLKATISDLRRKALREPVHIGTVSGFTAYIAKVCGGTAGTGQSRDESTRKVSEAAKNWKALTPAEHEHYNHLANAENTARRAELQAWIHSHTPEEIRTANKARALLRTKLAGTLKRRKHPAHTTRLPDDRHIKQAASSYALFFKERWASGDMKSIKVTDAAKLIGNEWKALSASEKKKYQDEYQTSKARVTRERAALSS